jgi:hypothetical protein
MKGSNSNGSDMAKRCSSIFAIAGALIFSQGIAPKMFGDPAVRGFSFAEMLGAALAGGVCAVLGYGIGN